MPAGQVFSALDPNAFNWGDSLRQGAMEGRDRRQTADLARLISGGDYAGATKAAGQSGNLDRLVSVLGLQRQAVQDQRATKTYDDAQKKEMGGIGYRAAKVLLSIKDPAQRRAAADRINAKGRELGYDFPAFTDAELQDDMLTQKMQTLQAFGAGGKPAYTLSPGEAAYDDQNQPIAQAPFKPDPSAGLELERFKLSQRSADRQDAAAERQAAAAERQASNQTFDNEQTLRTRFDTISNDYRDVTQQFQTLKSVGAREDAAGDLALIVAYTKMLDPGSVAREGEVNLTQQTAGALQQAKMLLPRIQSGKTLLPREVRAQLLGAASDIYAQYQAAFQKRVGEYQGLAGQYGFDPSRIVVGYGRGGGDQGSTGDAEVDALLDKYAPVQ